MNACCTGDGFPSCSSPSSVLIAPPVTPATGVTHERIVVSPKITVHAPHCARPHQKRAPRGCGSWRSTEGGGVPGLACRVCSPPLTGIKRAISPPFRSAITWPPPGADQGGAGVPPPAAARQVSLGALVTTTPL